VSLIDQPFDEIGANLTFGSSFVQKSIRQQCQGAEC